MNSASLRAVRHCLLATRRIPVTFRTAASFQLMPRQSRRIGPDVPFLWIRYDTSHALNALNSKPEGSMSVRLGCLAAALTVAMGIPAMGNAQMVTPLPEIWPRWAPSVATKPVYVYYVLPPACDNDVLYGLNKWNAAGARFAFTWPSSPVTEYRNNELGIAEDMARITVEDGVMPSDSPNAQAATSLSVGSDGYLKDADIFINENYLFWGTNDTGDFFCTGNGTALPPSNKYDYLTVITHELGHAIGFQEYPEESRCIMYPTLAYGQYRRNLCNAEYAAFRNVYGVR